MIINLSSFNLRTDMKEETLLMKSEQKLVLNASDQSSHDNKSLNGIDPYTALENDCTKLELSSTLIQITGSPVLHHILESETPVDTCISCKGGKIGVHRVVLASASPFIAKLFKDQRLEPGMLILPDISCKVMEILVQLCYTGKMIFPKILEDEVYDAMKTLMIGEHARFSLNKVTVKLITPPSPPKLPGQGINPSNSRSLNQPTSSTQQHFISSINTSNKPKKTAVLEDLELDDSDSKDSEDGSDDDNQTLKAKKMSSEKIPGFGLLLKDGKYECRYCNNILSCKISLIRHLKSFHNKKMISKSLSLEEFKELTFCFVCNKRHESLSKTQQCLTTHHYSRCFVCLGIFPTSEFMNHLKKGHGVKTKHGLVSPCRWCSIAITISTTGISVCRHFMGTHANNTSTFKDAKTEEKLTMAPIFSSRKNPINSLDENNCSSTISNTIVSRCKRNLEDQISTTSSEVKRAKKRKLDENGKPIPYSKRTGVPLGKAKKRNLILPSMKFTNGTFPITLDELVSKIKNQQIHKLPKAHIHLNKLTNKEIKLLLSSEPDKSN